MTALGSGSPDRESTTDEAPRRGIGRELTAILAIGLVFRLILAYAIDGLRGSGFEADLGLFNYWADTLAEFGPWGFYANASYADYTPGYLYALWPIGALRDIAFAVGWPQDVVDSLIKLPAILTDLAVAWIVASMVLELGVSRRRALIAAAVVVINPITWFDSVIWGQVDSFGTVFLLLGIRELWRGRHERAAILAVIAALVKPQLAILVPIVAIVVIRRALWPKGGYGDEDEAVVRRPGFSWELRPIGALRILTVGVTGFVTAVLLSLPFGLTVLAPSAAAPFLDSSLLRLVFSTAATYPYLTVNAYNWWALFPVDGQSAASAGGALWIPDSPVADAAAWGALGPLPAGAVGAVLLLGTAALVAWAVARRPDRLTILVGVSVLALAFFAAPTRVHERYLFPFFGLAAILLAISWRWAIVYVVAAVATFLNMYVVLVAFYDNPQISDWLGIGDALREPFVVATIAVLHSAAFLWGVAQLRPGARRTLARELEAAGTAPPAEPEASPVLRGLPPDADAGPVPGAPPAGSGAIGLATMAAGPPAPPSAAGGVGAVAVAGAVADRRLPAWYDRPTWTEMGPIAWLRARVNETPVRPDRSWLLGHERRGRIDRVDLLVVLVLVLGALVLRTYRLGDPARMHFDEVYHARTAAEFLQDWRYGLYDDIYEWTHPHLAKYAMALGIATFAGHDAARSGDLGVPVLDAAVEPRREDPTGGGDLTGDRLWVATGTELVAFDQASRRVAARWPVPGASAVTYDDDGLRILVGTDAGEISSIDTTVLDFDRGGDPDEPGIDPFPVATLPAGVTDLAPYRGGALAAAITDDGQVVVFGMDTGTIVGSVPVAGAAALESPGDVNAVLVLPAVVEDPERQAGRLAELLGGDEAEYLAALTATDEDNLRLPGTPDPFALDDLKAAMDEGELPGVEFQPVPTMVVAGDDGLTFLDADGAVFATVDLAGAAGLAQVSGVEEGTQLYVTTTNAAGEPVITVVEVTGEAADTGPNEAASFRLPGAGTTVVFDEAAELVEVLGVTADGAQPTVYVVEPHGKSVFADHKLAFAPTALALDHDPEWPSSTTGELLAFGSGGQSAAMDVSSYHFSWRLPGVMLGALTVAVLYLLARILFSRRAVAVFVGLFAVLDGMLFVQSRLAMNDVYTGFFILAAYLLFAWLWLEPERVKRAFWLVAPAMGVLLGLALASKWVAAYAIGALGILVLMRSALGRILLILGMVGITTLLSWIALAVPEATGGTGNLPFVLIMIGLTLATVVISVYRPVEWSDDEVRFAVGAPAVAGILLWLTTLALGTASDLLVIGPVQFTPLQAGFALVVTGLLAYGAFAVAGRLGVGPMKPAAEPGLDDGSGPPPASPAPEGWVRLGWGLGIPAMFLGVCLLVIPLGVYVLSYWPWAQLGGNQIVAGLPAGHAGDTLIQLTGRMYDYHNGLTAAHAASSPWWAWPLNLKPVWFYQGSYAESTAASIYDAGNMVIWWMGIPAMAFIAFQSYRRRSLSLALILVAFLAQWVSWARIDRASFQYHYYTSLPFVILALGYFVAEIWHGPSRRTWLLARASAAVALMGPVILWLLRYPMCAVAGVESVSPGSQACNGNPGNLVVTPAVAAMVVVALVTVLVLLWQLLSLNRPREDGRPLGYRDLMPIVATAAVGGVALAIARLLPDGEPLFTVNGVVPEIIALIAAVPLGLIAIQVLTARDAQRFVAGLVTAAAAWFVILYPNIAALPMPSALVNVYQGLLPTYLYAFQFNVNTTARPETSFSDPGFLVLAGSLVVACVATGYLAWAWRQALGQPPEERGEQSGPAGEPGSA